MISRLEERASQIRNISKINLMIEIIDPIDEIIFHDKKLSG